MRRAASSSPNSHWQWICGALLHHPLRSLSVLFVLWKLLLLLAIVASPGPGYDSSTTLLPSDASQNASDPFLQRVKAGAGSGWWPSSLLKFVRWDAIYFVSIAQRGYLFEQEWAFGYGYTRVLSVLSYAFWGDRGSDPDSLHVALTGIGLSHVCHYLSVLSLYGLSRNVFGSGDGGRALPLLAAVLHIISPAGAFLSAPYGEPVFSLLNFTGYYAYVSALHDDRRGYMLARDVKFLVAGGLFAVVTTIRSNGVLSGMLFAYDAVLGLANLVSSGISISQIHRMFFVILGGSLILLGVIGPQYRAFTVYCQHADARRSWCDNTIPSIYTFVQTHYWGSGGFLSYWKLSNLPLFCLAAPMLIVMGISSWWPFQSPVDFDMRYKEQGQHEEAASRAEHRRTCLYRLAIPQGVLAALVLTNSHVQIINRISCTRHSCFLYKPFDVIPSFFAPHDFTLLNANMDSRERLPDHLAVDHTHSGNVTSRATSPGGEHIRINGVRDDQFQETRHRPRTYPYFKYLPYHVEDESERQNNLEEILKHLYIAVESGDFSPGAVHWTRELKGWLSLKFDPTREQRIKLVQFYYELSLAPGIDPNVAERFATMFMLLTKRKHYLRPGKDLILDWKPLYREIKVFVLPSQSGLVHSTNLKRNIKTLTKLCAFAQPYFDPLELRVMLEEFLPHFSASFTEGAFVVAGLINLFLPTAPAPEDREDLLPQQYLPTYFHLWSLVNRSRTFDVTFTDLLSRMARDALPASYIPFSEFGIFTSEQTSLVFTTILRLLEIPVGQATSTYSSGVDASSGLGLMLERDPRKHPFTHNIARWIVMSLSPACLESENSILSMLEGLIEAVETFFHPSNAGGWSKALSQLVYYLADFFVMRWNMEHDEEMEVAPERRLNDALKQRFVLCLREVTFMGIYSKLGVAMNFALSTLQSLAYLEPNLILPGALQRIYPSLQGLVEVHRTTSSLRSLQVLSRLMARTKGFRCHITTLLGLVLPGIDANDLEKSLHSLAFIQSVCYNIPFEDLTRDRDDVNGNMLAVQWITGELERMETDGASVEMNYETELTDKEEEMILRSSTTQFGEFLLSFLGRVFTLLENLPDAARVRSGSPEENVVNTLPATLMPLLASLSPELYDQALNKIVNFVSNHVIHQARDAMAFICNAVCKVNPEKALKALVPLLIQSIRTEIDENGAASTRTTGSDILPRDRGLVWNVSMLSMCVVHVGSAVLKYRKELFDIAIYMQQKCKGIPTVHVSNFIHHLLLNLTVTYVIDHSLYEPDIKERGIQVEQWGQRHDPNLLTIKWHVPQREELEFAVELFKSQAENALDQLTSLTSETPNINRDGSGKEWSDEVTRKLVLLRLIISGMSMLFDNKAASNYTSGRSRSHADIDVSMSDANDQHSKGEISEDDSALDGSDDSAVRQTFQYPTGYLLKEDDPLYIEIHDIRRRVGEVLHNVHRFLVEKQEDDVSCFTPLYTAYRSWFVDVGIEKSAHILDRVTKLLAADTQPYKVSGLRKDYPRPLLVRRANVYHVQRLRHNAAPRPRSKLDETLLFDLAESSISLYTDIRRSAQGASESALKAIWGSRLLIIPTLIQALQNAIKTNDYRRLKGAIYSILYSSIAKPVGRHWKYAPALIKAFIEASAVDKPSIQRLCSGVVYQIMDYGRPMERMAVLDQDIIKSIAPKSDVRATVNNKREGIQKKRALIEQKKAELAEELTDMARVSHWKMASRTAAIVIGMGLRFDYVASENLVNLIIQGSIDSHPSLRGLYSQTLVALFTMVDVRAVCNHKYEDYIMGVQRFPAKIQVPTQPYRKGWTEEYLASFAKPEAEYYVDHDYPGWLVWGKAMPAYKSNVKQDIEYDELEWNVRKQMGKLCTREWFSTFFKYLKQEPRDAYADKFRMSSAMTLLYVFELMLRDELTAVTFEEIKEEIALVFEDGSDKHQHRATAEILGALIGSVTDTSVDKRTLVWEYAFPIVRQIFSDGLTPENSGYWTTFLHMVMQCRDPRRLWPLVDWLTSFRLDMNSNAAFKESSKINLLHQCILDFGWHFQLEKPIVADFLAHLDHPYKGVREAMGHTLGSIYRTRYHESFADIEQLVQTQKEASSIGSHPYKPTKEFTDTIVDVFNRLEKWRRERTPGQQTPSSYTSGSKTVLLWLDSTLSSHECTQLLQFFPGTFTEELLHMMDVKEDQELQRLAYHVFRHLSNVPHPPGDDSEFVEALTRIGLTSSSWHQRLRVMINIQIMYFRRLFLLPKADRDKLFDCIACMLEDTQPEVRSGASATLSGMIRCSPARLRTDMVLRLRDRFTKALVDNPLPKKARRLGSGVSSGVSTGASTPNPEHTRLVLTRHAAVLGLGALIQAFPYTSPPPQWMPGVLITLSNKAAGDPGIVGQGVKSIISEFKKTRQDTWHIDVKAFEPDQVEDLAGVLWKSYFA
ncbi:proteasome activator subunit 4 [Blastomyces parvus]|uniref:Proteasome activator subunit 4 n=1 Tax=Blastomyces parvus TaxID=2060905 RepID=A0A2B7X005_9EURO|nr:proteasome activator subunit 4 [Blastomyces parvus]